MKPIRMCLATAMLMTGLSLAFGQPIDPASLAPKNAIACFGWSKLNDGNWELLKAAEALLNNPEIAEEMEVSAAFAPHLVRLIDELTRGTAALVLLAPETASGKPSLGLIVAAGDRTAALLGTIETLLNQSGIPRETATVDGVEFQAISFLGESLRWTAHEKHLIVALGEPAAKALLGRARGTGESLADTAEYKSSLAKTGVGTGDWCFTLYGNVQEFFKFLHGGLRDADLPRMMASLGVDKVTSIMLRIDEVDFGPRMAVLMRTGGATNGIWRLYQQSPITPDDLAIIPHDAYWAKVWNFRIADAWEMVRSFAETLSPEDLREFDEQLAEVERQLGFSIAKDVLPAFGDTWALYDAPSHGGVLVTGIVLAVDVASADALQQVLTKLVAFTARELAGEDVRVQLREMKRGEHTIHYVLFGGAPVPIAPAWTFAEGRWVLGLFPQTVASALTQITPATRGKCLTEHLDYVAAAAHIPAKFTSISFTDQRAGSHLLYTLYQLGRTVVASLTSESPAPFDLSAAPTFAEANQNARAMVYVAASDADGVLYSGVGVSPAAFLPSLYSGDAATTALMISALLPSLSRARELANRAVCAANLRGIAQGCFIYANDHNDKHPPSLAALVTEGFFTPKQFVCPSSGHTEGEVTAALNDGGRLLCYVYIAGQDATTDPRNVLIYEPLENHAGEGGNLLFGDGHVEFRKADSFKQAIRETYQRLKRENELPAEFKE